MVEEFHCEDDALLQDLQDLDALVLVLFGVVGVVHCHNHQARRGNLVQVLDESVLNYLEKTAIL